MDQITLIEDAIVARLKDMLQAPGDGLSAAVLPFPDNDFEKYEPMHQNGEILVAYVGEENSPATATDLIEQDREIQIELTFVFSSLRSVGKTGGLYSHLEATRLKLTGFTPESCSRKTEAAGVQRVKRYKKRWWQYVQTWKVTALSIEVPPEDQDALLQRITAINDTMSHTLEVPDNG